ncbi:helix-turn-helix domain-containing protein [Chromatiaceae bacterium AAb-1]|nr:helix-turn-helix domain-containing protein [Chromatiaceae bacterium AAb-1]
MAKRDLFAELMQGVNDMTEQRQGKVTLRKVSAESKPVPHVTAQEIVNLRQKLHLSQAVFAQRLRLNPETLKNWEQSKSKPNGQAAILIKLVEKYPDMIERLASV